MPRGHRALGYDYLGNCVDREGNANIESKLLRAWLNKQGVPDVLITRALHVLDEAGRRQEQEPLRPQPRRL